MRVKSSRPGFRTEISAHVASPVFATLTGIFSIRSGRSQISMRADVTPEVLGTIRYRSKTVEPVGSFFWRGFSEGGLGFSISLTGRGLLRDARCESEGFWVSVIAGREIDKTSARTTTCKAKALCPKPIS